MNEDISIALEIAEEMKVSRDELLITGVKHLYGCGNLEQAKKVMELGEISLFASCLEILSKERMRMLLLDQPYIHKHLSEPAKLWIDENYEQRPAKECKIADADTIELFQQQTEIIHDLLLRLHKAWGDSHADADKLVEVSDICAIMKQSTFAEWYEESYETEEPKSAQLLE